MVARAKFQVGEGGAHTVTAQRLCRHVTDCVAAEQHEDRNPGQSHANNPFHGLDFDRTYRRAPAMISL